MRLDAGVDVQAAGLMLDGQVVLAGDVVSRAQILDNVWDSAYEGSDNIVEVYIGYLRKKLDAPFNLNTLRTVRGLGYRLDADTTPATDPQSPPHP